MWFISIKKKKTYIERFATLFTTTVNIWYVYFTKHTSKAHYFLYIPHFNLYFLSKPDNVEHLPSVYILSVLSGDISIPLLVLVFASSSRCTLTFPPSLKISPKCLMQSSVQHSGGEGKGWGQVSTVPAPVLEALHSSCYQPHEVAVIPPPPVLQKGVLSWPGSVICSRSHS